MGADGKCREGYEGNIKKRGWVGVLRCKEGQSVPVSMSSRSLKWCTSLPYTLLAWSQGYLKERSWIENVIRNRISYEESKQQQIPFLASCIFPWPGLLSNGPHQQGHGRSPAHLAGGITKEASPMRSTFEAGGTEKRAGPLGRMSSPGQRLDAGSRGRDQLQKDSGEEEELVVCNGEM